jgi:tetratricopeptide (TPR) repeat protein
VIASNSYLEILHLALACHQQGRLPEAEALYRRVLQLEPTQADALRLIGILFHQRGELELARHFLEQALQAPTASADSYHALGLALEDLGRPDAAIAAYEKALQLRPDHPPSLLQFAMACEKEDRLADAESCLRRLVAIDPNSALAHLKLATALEGMNELEQAQFHAETAVRCAPENPEAYLCLGSILVRRNQVSDAVPFFNHAVQLDPVAGACAAQMLKEVLSEGQRAWEKRLASDPEDFDALSSLAKIRYSEKQPLEAIALLERALAVRPGEPNAEYALGFAELLLGRFETGWKHYEARFRTGQPQFPNRKFVQPVWRGEELGGRTIFVHAEQGVGDTIQFVRYVSLVAERGGRVVLECQSALKPLLETLRSVHHLVAQHETLPPFELQTPLLSLPAIFGTTLKTIPHQVPYLRVPDRAPFQLPAHSEGDLKVGFVWAGNPTLQNDLVRSVPLNQLSPLFSMPKISFFSLQVGPASRQLAQWRDAHRIIDLKPQLLDFAATAAAIRQLDLVISVDTAVAHLTGALAKPVWLLLPFAPEWRWLLGRTDSPWYPTMRLYRQSESENWTEVVERVREDVQKLKPLAR